MDNNITEAEIEKSARDLKTGKSPGIDAILPELLKNGLPQLKNHMLELFNTIFTSSTYPLLWQKQLLCAVHKKGNAADPGNY